MLGLSYNKKSDFIVTWTINFSFVFREVLYYLAKMEMMIGRNWGFGQIR